MKTSASNLHFRLLSCLLTLALASGFVRHARADETDGVVSMQGSILAAACAIATEDREQTVDMGTVVIGTIMNKGGGGISPLVIHLVNCQLAPYRPGLPDWSVFRVTFDSSTDESGLFAVEGSAKGVGLEIADQSGNVAVAGEAMPAGSLQPGSLALAYTMRLKSNHQPIQEGEFRSTIRFKTDYY
ncbi:fimbrial protein [Lelliottia nimipressuralis]